MKLEYAPSFLLIVALSCEVHCLNFGVSNCSDLAIVNMSADSSEECYSICDLPTIKSNSEVRFYAIELFLARAIEFVDVYNVSVIGYNNTVLVCNNTQAGLLFRGVQNLVIENIEVHNCGLELNIEKNSFLNIRASIVIQECGNVSIMNSKVKNGPGTGLALFNIENALSVLNTTFESNGYDRESGENGVYLEISADSSNLGSSVCYNFTRCKFIENKADTGKDNNISGFSWFDKGGGLCCSIRSNAYGRIAVTIENSFISGNTAGTYGGGILASFSNDARNGVFLVRRSNYTRNNATYGGGHFSSYLHNQNLRQQPLNCNYSFEENIFTDNWAVFGGGFSASPTPTNEPSNRVKCC